MAAADDDHARAVCEGEPAVRFLRRVGQVGLALYSPPLTSTSQGGTHMRAFAKLTRLVVLSFLLTVVPAQVYAQATIAGVVKDTSGAILPGVTVEASSPALIEKIRSVVTDGTGQFQ